MCWQTQEVSLKQPFSSQVCSFPFESGLVKLDRILYATLWESENIPLVYGCLRQHTDTNTHTLLLLLQNITEPLGIKLCTHILDV